MSKIDIAMVIFTTIIVIVMILCIWKMNQLNKKAKARLIEREKWQKTLTGGDQVELLDLKAQVVSVEDDFALLHFEDRKVHISHLRKPE